MLTVTRCSQTIGTEGADDSPLDFAGAYRSPQTREERSVYLPKRWNASFAKVCAAAA